jgi:hypothetical protein
MGILPAPLFGVKFALEEYPKMPIVGWVYLGIGVVLLIVTLVVRGMKFSGLMASLAFLLYYPAAYAIYWYAANYLADGSMPSTLEMAMLDPMMPKIIQITLGVLGGIFFLCMLEAGINYRHNPEEGRKRRYSDYADAEAAAVPPPVVPPPLPGTRPPAPRPAPGTTPPRMGKPAPKRPGPPRGNKNPFDFT